MKHLNERIVTAFKKLLKKHNKSTEKISTLEESYRFLSSVQSVLDADSDNEPAASRHDVARHVVSEYQQIMTKRRSAVMGYPSNHAADFEGLEILNQCLIESVGNPFMEGDCDTTCCPFEAGVIEWFAKLWELNEGEIWGYITNGGTEGNLHGLYVGSECLPDGILYTSSESHYSVFKAARMYRMSVEEIPSVASGEIDYSQLKQALLKNRDRPAILNVNIGTTFKGAIDDLDKMLEILKETGYTEDRFYVHCDAALFGVMLPFLETKGQHMVSFKKPIGSVSVSGHKFLGAVFPCGVVITRQQYIKALCNDEEYLNSRDLTILGCRDGRSTIYMWYTLSTKGYYELKKDVEQCLQNARYLKKLLQKANKTVMLNEFSNTVVFERPKDPAFIKKWHVACKHDSAHVIVMPSITAKRIEDFVEELLSITTDSTKILNQKKTSKLEYW